MNKHNINIEQKAKTFSLFGDPTRLRIIKVIADRKEINVSDIAESVGMSIACISHHLQLLKDNKVVSARRLGNTILYKMASNPLINNIKQLI